MTQAKSKTPTRSFTAAGTAGGLVAMTLLAVSPAAAQTPRAVATFGDWGVFEKVTGDDKICFAATEAKSKQPSNVKHGDVFFLVATWKSGAAINQPSLMTGYNLRAAPEPKLRVGSDSWELYASENEAFVESDADERRLVTAMRRGATMRVSAMSERGTATSYAISLSGVTAALRRVEEACR
ncbi:MAG: invasion associated locus B family protein [Pseudomonadota bacterium]